MSSFLKKYALRIRVSLLAVFSLNAVYAALQNSAVCDELGAHIPCGYMYWSTGIFGGGINNPPLGQLLIALPVKIFGLSYDLYTEQHLFLFRIVGILMAVLLGELIYRFASALFDASVGTAALFLYAFSPNILAHATLATLDFPVVFFIFLAVFLLYRYVEKPGLLRMLWLGTAAACAMLVKVQALLLLVIIALAFIVFFKPMVAKNGRNRYLLFGSWLLIPAAVVVITNIVYLNLPPATGQWIPPEFVEAIRGKIFHAERGHFAYLLGRYSTEGWWYYFPAAILFKTPLPVLLLFLAGLFRRHSRKTVVYVIVPLLLLLAVAMRGRVNIGLRHVLTIYPFLFIIAAYPLSRLWNRAAGKIAFIVLAGWYIGQAVYITPHHLSYFNVPAGGPENGHRCLIDSNYDWGQNDKFLRKYVESRGIEYKIDPDPFHPSNGHILVNANALYGVLNRGEQAYAWLKKFEPVNRVAFTWFEYDVPDGTFAERPDYEEIRRVFISYVIDMRERYASMSNIQYHFDLARLCTSFRAYDLAFAEYRDLLSRQPDSRQAFAMGGELAVRYKLGVLPFRGMEYLHGDQSSRFAGVPINEETVIAAAKRTGVGSPFSMLYNRIGVELFQKRNINGAVAAFEKAVAFDPDNRDAVTNLNRLRQPSGR